MASKLYPSLLLLCVIWYATSQKIPDIACTKYYELERNGSEYIGRITLPNATLGSTKLDVKVSVPGILQANEKDRIKLSNEPRTMQSSAPKRIPPSYRLEFPELNEVPKITTISVNNFAICADEEYTAPSTTAHLEHTLEPEVFDPACGNERFSSPLIHGGYAVERGQYPWLTTIYQLMEDEEMKTLCGGSLISSRTIISAAHCFTLGALKPTDVSVTLGQYNITDHSANGVVHRNVIKLLIHPEYNPRLTADADIAMLHLDSPVSFSDYISPICLWSEPADVNLIHGIKARVAGWAGVGQGRIITPLPQQVDTTIATESDCIRQNIIYVNFITNRTLCAGNLDNTGPCVRSSGNGLMIKRGGIWMLRGITSVGRIGKGQCDLGSYVIYCDLAKHINWVRENKLE